jgi:hypothetical protein
MLPLCDIDINLYKTNINTIETRSILSSTSKRNIKQQHDNINKSTNNIQINSSVYKIPIKEGINMDNHLPQFSDSSSTILNSSQFNIPSSSNSSVRV